MRIEVLKKAKPRVAEDTEKVTEAVKEILRAVREKGETAVRFYSEKFDHWNPPFFRVSEDEVFKARKQLSQRYIKDTEFCQRQVRNFAELQLRSMKEFEAETLLGVHLGQKLIPIASCGCYVPGGRYPLVASAHMSIIPAKVAGVKRVVACTPPREEKMNPATLYAIHAAGADEIYCIGGVQALAAMAYGMGDLKPVGMIVGPGNRYVVEAKKQLFGHVGIDLLAGPSEILIIADGTADPHIVAADLLGQSEHDLDARAILITTSRDLAEKTLNEVNEQLKDLPTKEVAGLSWERNGEVVVVDSYEEAANLADEYAPEHLEVQTKDPKWFLNNLKNYGSLFLGEEATVAYSDKTMGPNHILPTGRAARYTGGLWVGKFIKTVTYQWLTRGGSNIIADVAARQCRVEGMFAHERTAKIRLTKYASDKV